MADADVIIKVISFDLDTALTAGEYQTITHAAFDAEIKAAMVFTSGATANDTITAHGINQVGYTDGTRTHSTENHLRDADTQSRSSRIHTYTEGPFVHIGNRTTPGEYASFDFDIFPDKGST